MLNTKRGKKGGGNLKVRVQVVFETRRHSRSQESPVSLLLIQSNRQKKQEAQYNKDQTPPKNSILPHVIIPRNKQMTSTRIQKAYRLVITII